MTNEQNAIYDIIHYLYDNREDLSKDKDSGVHKIDGVYRVHKYAFVPRVLNSRTNSVDKSIANVVLLFPGNLVWDQPSLWLTIYDLSNDDKGEDE